MRKTILAGVAAMIMIGTASNSNADCVYAAKTKMTYEVLDSHTVRFKGGFTRDFIFKTYSNIKPDAKIVILKDYFCSFERAVLNVDGELVGSSLVIKQQF